jgi:hypothetical protein
MKNKGLAACILLLAAFVLDCGIVFAQDAATSTSPPSQTPTSTEERESPGSIDGTVVSASRETMVVRTDDNRFHLFVFDSDIVRPKALKPGARVRVMSNAMGEPGVRLATRVTVVEPGAPPEVARPPKEIRDLERDIEKGARKWQLGVRVGAGLDPELFLIGVHMAVGPIFSRDFYLRPNAEFGFGELTDMFALNLEGAYRLPINSRHGRWSSYVGAGPSFNFVHQGLERREIDFGNFEYETGLNIFSGLRFRRGTFVEVKTNLWAHPVPTLRMMIGYTF